MFGEYLSITEAFLLSIISISIVFSILLIIALIILSFKYIFKEKEVESVAIEKQLPVKKIEKVINLNEIEKDENKMVALLVASIASNDSDENKKFKVTSIKEI